MDDERSLDELLEDTQHLPTVQQVGAALAAAALVSPAALGGMPVLPVTIDDKRQRAQEQMEQESESSVGERQNVVEAATALSLSQRRLAAVTREVEGTHAYDIEESDVVRAAHMVAAGEVSPRKQRAFRSALGQVAIDSVDLFILLDDERWMSEHDEDEGDWDEDEWDEDDWDEEDWEGEP